MQTSDFESYLYEVYHTVILNMHTYHTDQVERVLRKKVAIGGDMADGVALRAKCLLFCRLRQE